jgi:two-component system, LytTR family, response regulator
MKIIKALIIDDESLAREAIKSHLKTMDHIELLGECKDGFEGLKMIQEHKPDLIFLDIQMPKLTGLELLEILDDPPVIIFSTAYDEYALKAFEYNAIDYLLKPYSRERFKEAVEKAIEKIGEDQQFLHKDLVTTHHDLQKESFQRIVVKNGFKIEVIPVVEIEYFEANDDYVNIYSTHGKFLKQITMKNLENNLSETEFVRIHRSYILNIGDIGRLENYEKGSHVVITKSGNQLPVSKSGYTRLKEVLNF